MSERQDVRANYRPDPRYYRPEKFTKRKKRKKLTVNCRDFIYVLGVVFWVIIAVAITIAICK